MVLHIKLVVILNHRSLEFHTQGPNNFLYPKIFTALFPMLSTERDENLILE